jgi:hypothetical protein
MKMKRDYHINIFYSAEDGCYVADLPDFEHCSALSDSPGRGAPRPAAEPRASASGCRLLTR